MKKSVVLSVAVLTICVFIPVRGWTGGMHFGGGYSGGHFSGGHGGTHFGGGHSFGYSGGGHGHGHFGGGGAFSGGGHHFGGGMYRNFGGPGPYTNYGSPAFRSPRFGHSPHRSYPPAFGSYYSYRRGVPFFSPGFSTYDYTYRQRLSPAGPPPIGAPGPTPSVPATPTGPLSSFYCAEHNFHYTNQQAFFGHLNFAHKVPLKNAAAYCQRTENGLIFSPY